MAPTVVGVLQRRGSARAMVVHGHDGIDELTITGRSTVWEVRDGDVSQYDLDPAALGPDGGRRRSAPGRRRRGQRRHRPGRVRRRARTRTATSWSLNAAAGLVVGGRADDLAAGLTLATAAIDDGRAAAVLDRLPGGVEPGLSRRSALAGPRRARPVRRIGQGKRLGRRRRRHRDRRLGLGHAARRGRPGRWPARSRSARPGPRRAGRAGPRCARRPRAGRRGLPARSPGCPRDGSCSTGARPGCSTSATCTSRFGQQASPVRARVPAGHHEVLVELRRPGTRGRGAARRPRG